MNANYHIKSTHRTSQFIQIELFIRIDAPQILSLQIPSWRSGRYQLADFAKNVRSFSAQDELGAFLPASKVQKNRWDILISKPTNLRISYEYYAAKMDAGSCWVDEDQIYLNFGNCCMEVLNFPELTYEMDVKIPTGFQLMSTLPMGMSGQFVANNFQQLVDATFLAAAHLTHWEYTSESVVFHCWFKGDIHFNKAGFLEKFQKFSTKQIRDFGEFPEEEYHFIFQLLPYRHYHGVEHKRGTVITFGPANSLAEEDQFEELLGISSHELYHAWNVCRIRPIELLPYDFSKETYTRAGWMLEGITTYMGDLYLLKSGVYSLEVYLKHLNHTLNRAFRNLGWQHSSILESSFDLWVDGYENGIPERKVNIYAHGCIIALCLDLMLLKSTKSSLPEVMQAAWLTFGKPNQGYTSESFWELFLNSMEDQTALLEFYQSYIAGNGNIFEKLKSLLPTIGLELNEESSSNLLEAKLGIITTGNTIIKVHPSSPAFQELMIGDEINYKQVGDRIHFQASRINGSVIQLDLKLEQDKVYFPLLSIVPTADLSQREKWMN